MQKIVYKKYSLSRLVTVQEIVSADCIRGVHLTNKPHIHEDACEIVYCVNDSVDVNIDDALYSLKERDFVLIWPDTTHNIVMRNPQSSAFIISFCCQNADHIRPLYNRIIPVTDSVQDVLAKALNELKMAFGQKNESLHMLTFLPNKDAPIGAEQMLCNYLEQVLILQMREITGKNTDPVNSSRLKDVVRSFIVSEVTEYIQNHIKEPITVEQIAAQFHYSRSRLSTIYKEQTGMGINETVSMVKLNVAKDLLCQTSMTVSQVSNELGYATPQYFSHKFRKETGCSPSAYAEKMKKTAAHGEEPAAADDHINEKHQEE